MFLNWTISDDNEAGTGALLSVVEDGGGDTSPEQDAGSGNDTVSESSSDSSETSSALTISAQAADDQCETASQNAPFSSQTYVLDSTSVSSSTTQTVFQLPSTSTTTTTPPPSIYACSSASTLSSTPALQLSTSMNHYSLLATTAMPSAQTASTVSQPTTTVSPLLAATAEPDATASPGHISQARITGAIVGSVVGAALFFCLLFVIFCLKRRRNRLTHEDHLPAEPPMLVRQDASPIPDTAANSPTLGHVTQLQPPPQPQPQKYRPHSTASWPSRLSSAILTPIRETIRPVSSSFNGSNSAPNSADQSAASLRGQKATRLLSGVFLVPPTVSQSSVSPSKDARGMNEERDAEQAPASPASNWPLRNSMPLRSSYRDRVQSAEYQNHQRDMFAAHQAMFDHKNEDSRVSLVYPPPTILPPTSVGRGAGGYRPSFVAGPEYVVDETMLAASPAFSRPVSKF